MHCDHNDARGRDPQATVTANLASPSVVPNGEAAFPDGAVVRPIDAMQGVHVLLDASSPADQGRDRYTLTELHGRGGMGQVWLALDKALGRLIALKELRPGQADNKALRSRFLYEAKITSQLEHPGIVPVYELGQGEEPYYTMRFVRGRTLSAAIRDYHAKRDARESNSIERIELLTAFVAVCHAMAYAHSRGIVHRDLKGQNVALGDFGEVMVLDWGLAKRVAPGQVSSGDGCEVDLTIASDEPAAEPGAATTVSSRAGTGESGDSTITDSNAVRDDSPSNSTLMTDGGASQPAAPSSSSQQLPDSPSATEHQPSVEGQILGTPGYMAPEQALGQHDRVDERTDVYGLGAILYEILTGRPPFLGFANADIIRRIREESPTSPRKINPAVEPGLEAICLKALRKQPDERYLSASELAQDMQRWLADLPVRAYREPWTSHALRWARRHKTIVAAAGGLLATAAIALAVSATWVAILRNEAEAQGQQARHAVQLLTKVADIGFDDQLDPLQREFLEGALAYYEQLTSRTVRDPTVQEEHGRVYQQMGDIERKLGRFPQSALHYGKAIEVLEPLVKLKSVGAEAARALARSRTLLADLLVRSGDDRGRAEGLYNQALAAQKPLAIAPAATALDLLRLGQTIKSQADLLRLNGRFSQAKPGYEQAIAALEKARTADPRHPEVRNDLAIATDARGWIDRELGDVKAAEQDYRGALAVLETLLAEFPTSPRYRESLARVCNSLGLIEQSTGRLSDAEAHFRRELPLVERLVQDFPDRPEHKRELARTLMNLGNVLGDLGRSEEAEPTLVRAVELNSAIAATNPRDVQVRLDLTKCDNNLGELLRAKGEIQQALTCFAHARSISEKLVDEFPDKPRYREALAGTLTNVAIALQSVDPAKSEATHQTSLTMYEKLVAEHPDNIDYRIGEARCLYNLGPLMAASQRHDKAEDMYRRALAVLDIKNAGATSRECLRQRAIVLINFGGLQVELKRPEAEVTLVHAIGAFESLAARPSPTLEDRQNLAIAHANLGNFLVDVGRLEDAASHFASSVAGFDSLVAEHPRSLAAQSFFGMVLEMQSRWLDSSGKLEEAKRALASAISHQRQAVELGQNADIYRERLGSHMLELAWIDLELGADDEAAKIALDLPKTVPSASRPRACFDAARVLARLVSHQGADASRDRAEFDTLTRNYIGRIALYLREAIDTDPKLAAPIKADADIKRLVARPEFREVIHALVDLSR